jgi:hypothetical protein
MVKASPNSPAASSREVLGLCGQCLPTLRGRPVGLRSQQCPIWSLLDAFVHADPRVADKGIGRSLALMVSRGSGALAIRGNFCP